MDKYQYAQLPSHLSASTSTSQSFLANFGVDHVAVDRRRKPPFASQSWAICLCMTSEDRATIDWSSDQPHADT